MLWITDSVEQSRVAHICNVSSHGQGDLEFKASPDKRQNKTNDVERCDMKDISQKMISQEHTDFLHEVQILMTLSHKQSLEPENPSVDMFVFEFIQLKQEIQTIEQKKFILGCNRGRTLAFPFAK